MNIVQKHEIQIDVSMAAIRAIYESPIHNQIFLCTAVLRFIEFAVMKNPELEVIDDALVFQTLNESPELLEPTSLYCGPAWRSTDDNFMIGSSEKFNNVLFEQLDTLLKVCDRSSHASLSTRYGCCLRDGTHSYYLRDGELLCQSKRYSRELRINVIKLLEDAGIRTVMVWPTPVKDW